MKKETGKVKILFIILAVFILASIAICGFIFSTSFFVFSPKVANEDSAAEQIVEENALGEGVAKLDNGVYFKQFTAAEVEGLEESPTRKGRYEKYIDTGNTRNYYYKIINTYQEYLEFKAIQPSIIEMDENYFEHYYMLITAPMTDSYIGYGLDRIDVFEDRLYISYKYIGNLEDKEFIRKNQTSYNPEIKAQVNQLIEKYEENECMCLMIPQIMKRDKFQILINLTNEEKDFSPEVKLSYRDEYPEYDDEKKERKDVSFVYLDKMSRQAIAESLLGGNPGLLPHEYNWKNSIAENITITKDMPEIDFSSWQNLGNDYYAIRLTDFSEYKKMIDYYGIRKLNDDNDFKHIFATIIVRKNVNNSISAEEVTVDESGVELKVKTGDPVEVDENVKYPGLVVYTPNYMNLDGVTNLNIIVE